MFCQECGAKLPENSRFCPMCGAGAAAASSTSKAQGVAAPDEAMISLF